MVFYFISNSNLITKEIIDDCNIKKTDKIFLFNTAFPLKYINREISIIQRWNGKKFIQTEENNKNKNIKEYYLLNNNEKYIKNLLKIDKTRKIKIINGLNYLCDFLTKKTNTKIRIFTGLLSLIYFSKKFKDEKIVFVGFTSYINDPKMKSEKWKQNLKKVGHDTILDRQLFLDYAKQTKNITLKYCWLFDSKLIDKDVLKDHKILYNLTDLNENVLLK